jgi:hypothetical protein
VAISQVQITYVTTEKTCSTARFHVPVPTTKFKYILTDGIMLHNKITSKGSMQSTQRTANGNFLQKKEALENTVERSWVEC